MMKVLDENANVVPFGHITRAFTG